MDGFENLPPGASVQWSAGNGNLQLISVQGSITAVFKKLSNGPSSIHASVQVGNQTVGINPLTVWGGDTKTIIIEDDGTTSISTSRNLTLFSSIGMENMVQVSARRFDGSPFINPQFNIENNSPALFSLSHSAELIEIFPRKAGSGSFTVTALSDCGSTSAFVSVNINDRVPFQLSPNPAASFVTITMSANEGTDGIYSLPASPTYRIQLWNSFGLVKTVQTDRSSYQLDLTGVPAGFYYVHVIKDGQTYRQQLVVK